MRAPTGLESSPAPIINITNAPAWRGWTVVALVLGITACADRGGALSTADTVVAVVRHAERSPGGDNPDLAAAGLARAESLVDAVRDLSIDAVYSTDFCRTAQTGQPTAEAMAAPLLILATGSRAAGLGSCSPAIAVPHDSGGPATASELANRILSDHGGEAVLVVGHSNTVPALVAELAGRSVCPDPIELQEGECVLPETAYGDLFIVRIPSAGETTIERRRFGT
jgi:phosphohistidine phosphatase SixA